MAAMSVASRAECLACDLAEQTANAKVGLKDILKVGWLVACSVGWSAA
jgi:hypothetical protein